MKSNLQTQTLVAIGILLVSVAATVAQPAPPAAQHATIHPEDLPALLKPPVPQAAGPVLDPSSGLPVAAVESSEPQWIDPNWSDPDVVLTNVVYDSLALSEVANHLRAQFKDYFDILPTPYTTGTGGESMDWGSTTIQLQLRNVRASEVFNAMNLVFENNRTPLRWELKSAPTRSRPLVLLRVLPEAAQKMAPEPKPPETHRMVYFVGHLVGDEKSGGMTMEQIVKTITDLWPADYGKPEGVLKFHQEAQLLVVNGTPEQLEFVHQTLAALEQKEAAARPQSAAAKDTEELVNLIKSLKSLGDNSK
jgi:hypothetical protein